MPAKPGTLANLPLEKFLQAARESGAQSYNALGPSMGFGRSSVKDEFRYRRSEEDRQALEEVFKKNKSRWAMERTAKPAGPRRVYHLEDQKISRSAHEDHDTVEATGPRIKTLEELLEAAEVDLSTWRVKDYIVNTWEQNSVDVGLVTLYQVKARLERIQDAIDLTHLKDAVIEEMKRHSPRPVRKYKGTADGELAMEIEIPDLHLGKLAHAEETGENYDGKIAIEAFRYVVSRFLSHAQRLSVSRIIFPVGNDLLHVDSASNETTAGTGQDVDSRWYRSVRRAVNLMAESIDGMAQIAGVDIVIVPGNHARMQESMLGEVMRAWYRNEERVVIHDSPAPRKYLRHGTTLLGFTHGDGIKAKELPLIMAAEAPEMWAQTTHRAWSIGHEHSRRSNKFGSVEEAKGVEVRMSPSLSASDSWHTSHGFIGNLRAAEAYVHSAQDGEIARFRAALPQDFGLGES